MISTILLFVSILLFMVFIVYVFIARKSMSKSRIILFLISGIVLIGALYLYTGSSKIKSDISRLVKNSSSKKAEDVYSLLFKKPLDSCLKIINFKDQVIPTIDCCIWMEVDICPAELARVIQRKKYLAFTFSRSDSVQFLASYVDRPNWWTPQSIGDSITKMYFKFDEDNEQTLFWGKDSSHVYLCDQAL